MPSLPESSPKLQHYEAVEKFKRITLSDPRVIRERYGNQPISFLRLIDPSMKFPAKLREIFAYLWREQDQKGRHATRFIIKGPRGGGKSKLLGAIGFVKWYLQLRNIVDMGGSLEQAKGVYNYFAGHIYAQDSILESLPTEPTMQKTQSDKGNYFKAVAASQKQVRGPHPDSLYIDEACETNDELIKAAMPMINTSKNPLIVMTSTFHKIFGYFQETWDDAEKLGWVRFSWDIFDVCLPFEPSIWDDERMNLEIPDIDALKQRAAGRTGDPEGWVNVQNIIQAWREKDTVDWFDVEYMGSRPSSTGMVNDPEDVDACTIDDLYSYRFKPGAEVIGGLDWGFSSMTAWVELMNHKDAQKVNIGEKHYSQVASEIIINDIVERVIATRMKKIYADSAGKFENDALKRALATNPTLQKMDHRCVVEEVVFSKDKEWMIGNYRAYFQRRLMRIPRAFAEALWQHKRYRYMPNSDKVVKKDDHIPDATQLALKHWPLGRAVNRMPANEESTERNREYSTESGGLLDEIF